MLPGEHEAENAPECLLQFGECLTVELFCLEEASGKEFSSAKKVENGGKVKSLFSKGSIREGESLEQPLGEE